VRLLDVLLQLCLFGEAFVAIRAHELFLVGGSSSASTRAAQRAFLLGFDTRSVWMCLLMRDQALLGLVRAVAVITGERPDVFVHVSDVNPEISHLDKGSGAEFTFVFFDGEMTRNVTIQVLLRNEGGAARHTLKVFRHI